MSGIVVEGSDGTGKTSLIRELLHTFRFPTIHVLHPTNFTQMIKLAYCNPVIFDRFHLSPVVYGKVLRDGPDLNITQFAELEDLLVDRGFVQIICMTRTEAMLENNRKEDQLWEEVRELKIVERLKAEYLVQAYRTKIPTLLYDYLDTSAEDVIVWVKERMR